MNGKTVNIPIYINEKGQYNRVFIDTNKVATAFGKENFREYIRRELERGNLVRIKKRGTQASERTALIAGGYSLNASGGIVTQSQDESQPLSDKNSKKYQQREDRSAQERLLTEYENPITVTDVETLRSIGRKSVNDFTSEDVQKSEKWAHKFYKEIGTKSPFFRAWFGDWRASDVGAVAVARIPRYIATNEARKANRGNVINNDTGWDIRISRERDEHNISLRRIASVRVRSFRNS